MVASRPYKVLLIDDTVRMHDLVRAHLEPSGYKLLSAYDGAEGLNAVLAHHPDLVLLDYVMPHMNGVEVFMALKENPLYREIRDTPIIMLTAKHDDGHIKTSLLEQGVSAYLQKPFGLRELTNVIENVFIISDIQRRNRQLAEEVQSTRDYLELLMRTAPIGIFSTDPEGRLRRANRVLSRLLGSEEQVLAGRSVFDAPLLRDTFLRTAVARVLTGQTSWKIRNFHFAKAGERHRVLNVHSVPLQKASGELEGVVGVVEDVTETQKRDEQLQMLSTIGLALQSVIDLDDLLHLILTAITAGPAFGFTRALIFLMDRTRQQLLGKMGVGPTNAEEARRVWEDLAKEHISLEDFLEKYGKHRPKTPTAFDTLVREQSIPVDTKDSDFLKQILQRHPYRGLPAKRDRSACQQIFSALQLSDFVAVPLVAKDYMIGFIIADNLFSSQPIDADHISLLELFASQAAQAIETAETYRRLALEKRKLEHAYEELQATHKRLVHAERLAAIGKMAAHVAHEIRNPLVTIGGFARTLSRQTQDAESLKATTAIIADEVIRLERILADVLDFTRMPSSTRQSVDLNRIVCEVCSLLENEAKLGQVVIEKTLDLTLPNMQLDPVQMSQLLVNLMRNSIQAMPNGGELEVSTVRLSPLKHRLLVRDNGYGIKPELLDNIFTPFFTTKPHGTGLGLAICRHIVNEHGGEITVQSEVGKGTRFIIDLPITPQPAPQQAKIEEFEAPERATASPYLI
ncbi:MAG: ATP-binding protein [bacterium]